MLTSLIYDVDDGIKSVVKSDKVRLYRNYYLARNIYNNLLNTDNIFNICKIWFTSINKRELPSVEHF